MVTMWPQDYRLRDQHGHAMDVKVSLQAIQLLAPDSGGDLVIDDYAQSIGLGRLQTAPLSCMRHVWPWRTTCTS